MQIDDLFNKKIIITITEYDGDRLEVRASFDDLSWNSLLVCPKNGPSALFMLHECLKQFIWTYEESDLYKYGEDT